MNLKKMQKAVNIRAGPRGCDVALRATWQRHAGPRGAYAGYTYTYYLFIYYIYKGSSAFPIWEGLLIILIVGSYKLDDLCYFSPCGTNPHESYLMQVTWRKEKRRIGRGAEHGASIVCTQGLSDHIIDTCVKSGVITAMI